MLNIPITDLHKQYLSLKVEIDQAITEVCSNTDFILGHWVTEFEKQLSEYCSCNHAIGVASGTDALMLSLMAAGIQPGDEVITSPFTFIASSFVISRIGARPVFVDIEPDTFNINVSKLEEAITPRTRAILPVHLFGHPVEMDSLIKTSRAHDLYVFEDAAQSIGARYKDVVVGTLGDAGALSFFPTKNLGAYGDGGAILTNSSALADTTRILRQQGSTKKYIHKLIGVNSRLDTLQASILIIKLKRLNHWINERRRIADLYKDLLVDLPIILPIERPQCFHTYHQFTIRVPECRDDLQSFMRQQGVQTVVYYPLPVHLQPAYDFLGYKPGRFPIAENTSKEVLSLPCYPELSEDEVQYISNNIRRYFNRALTQKR